MSSFVNIIFSVKLSAFIGIGVTKGIDLMISMTSNYFHVNNPSIKCPNIDVKYKKTEFIVDFESVCLFYELFYLFKTIAFLLFLSIP